jgi:hypothetical protein
MVQEILRFAVMLILFEAVNNRHRHTLNLLFLPTIGIHFNPAACVDHSLGVVLYTEPADAAVGG